MAIFIPNVEDVLRPLQFGMNLPRQCVFQIAGHGTVREVPSERKAPERDVNH